MKTPRYHSDVQTNRDALYPSAVNSPLRFQKAVADDSGEDESDASDTDTGDDSSDES